MNKHGNLTPDEILKMIDSMDTITLQQKVELKLRTLYKFVKWTQEDYKEYKILLDRLKKSRKEKQEKTKKIGDALENLVNFIFEKSFFYKVHPNKHTSTNEIDQFVVMSDKGKQAIAEYNFSKELLVSNENHFLCECKNYDKKVGSTWVGKFNTLLDTCGATSVGIIFSYDGLSGQENNWYDAHGLTKIIYRITKDQKARFILDFNINDFEALLNPETNLFQLINQKKESLIANVKSEKLVSDKHEAEQEIKNIFEQIK